MRSTFFPSRQGSSAVEQGTHKPLVGSSILPPGMSDHALGICSERIIWSPLHWLGCGFGCPFRTTSPRPHCDTKRLGEKLEIVAKKEMAEARELERILKRKKNPKLAIYHLQQ